MAIGSNQALKISAVALGNGTKANGNSSMTIGEGTIANALGSFAIGRYNVDAPANAATTALTDKVFQIGDGTAPGLRKDILYVTRNGNMNITGCFTATNVMCPSDLRLKENIFPLENVFDKINNIQPITYYFKDKTNYPATHQIGFSAQEIEKEFPELVNKNEQGFLSVNYPQMSVVAIQAIKEQQQIINHQQNEITTLQKEVEELKIQMQKVMRNKF